MQWPTVDADASSAFRQQRGYLLPVVIHLAAAHLLIQTPAVRSAGSAAIYYLW